MKNKIVSFGEIVWDNFGDMKTLGGAPLNFAYFCSKFGCQSSIISAVGDDELGVRAVKKIIECDIDASAISINGELVTGIVDVSEGDNGLPRYDIRRPAAWDEIRISDSAISIARSCDAFCFGSLSQRSPISRQTLFAVIEELRTDCLKIFDSNLRQNYFDAQILADSLNSCDILKLNDEELPQVYKLLFAKPCHDANRMAEDIVAKFGLKFLVYTLGAKGHIIFESGKAPLFGTPEPVKVVDTVGAGDAFTAGFVSAILEGASVAKASAHASKSAAFACSRRGVI